MRPEKEPTALHYKRNVLELGTGTLDPSLIGKNDATFA
jgi:hypothetical protein